jgi:predicted Zn-ribbon and HTH transcriptional regulator
MCTVGGPPTGDLNYDDRVNAKTYRCKDCDEKFSHVNLKKKPVCPNCESDNVKEI